MTRHVYVGDFGFNLEFASQYDLTAMTNVRMLIKREAGAALTYDFSAGEFNTIGIGGTLSYTIRAGDLSVPGKCSFQPIAKKNGLDIAFKPLELQVQHRIAHDSWA